MIGTKHTPKEVGILDLEIYFPKFYVDQQELEVFDKVDKGKYINGLGQHKMAFVGDREDINSICLTVLEKLMKRNNIKPSDVGRLEVGTETFLDKSKSIKTYLMDFFKDANVDIEGVTTSNACYGGTNALLNAMNWITSDYYDGRYAIVIAADIAVYAKGNARPTGGCGSIAMLIGPNAPILFENVRATYMNNVYDFYKPNPTKEYPEVDGIFSLDCYFKSLESCYENYIKKYQSINGNPINLNYFDYFCFHAPFAKMVEKAFVQLLSYDLHLNNKNLTTIKNENNYYPSNDTKIQELIEVFSKRPKNFKLDPKLIAQIKTAFSDVLKKKVEPSLFLGKNLGNLYTGSLYAGLISVILDTKVDLTNKRLFMFSYGSGCAATLFSLKFKSNDYKRIRETNFDVIDNLNRRIKISPENYEKILSRKERLYLTNNYLPEDNIEELLDGTYYIEKVDQKWRRVYVRKGKDGRRIEFNKLNNKSQEQLTQMPAGERRLEIVKSQLMSGKGLTDSGLPRKIVIEDNIWSGFHKKSIHERLLQIKKVYPEVNIDNLKTGGLNLMRAENMIENCIGIISMPIGLGLHFTINTKKYNIPMAVEEPSVIAAVSNAAKLISENNGFFCYSDPPLMISQVHFIDTDTEESEKFVNEYRSKLISIANGYCQDMVQRGGGVKELYSRVLEPSSNGQPNGKLVIEAIVDVRDSMGANTLSTVAEGLASYIQPNIKGTPILKIISNLAIYRKSTAEFKINIKNLSYKDLPGEEIARRIVQAYEIAAKDPFRASTHNKGIMNGIDAVAIALGQDWRALEAGAHVFASFNNQTQQCDTYTSLTYYKIVEVKGERYLYGNLTLPIACGVVGGAINSNENYQNMLKLLGNPTGQQLGQIMVAVGLAQNFAALRALVSEGIQRGHMGLHARNFAIKANVPDYLIPDVVNFMKNNKSISEKAAKNYLESVHIYTEMRGKSSNRNSNGIETKGLSSFYIEIDYPFLKEPIVMNFLLNNKIEPPIHFALRTRKVQDDDNRVMEVYKTLFGEPKDEWLQEFVRFISHFDISNKYSVLSELHTLKYKLKMIVILLHVASYNMLSSNFNETREFLEKMIAKNYKYEDMLGIIPNDSFGLNFGLSVILELFEVMKFYFMNYVKRNKDIAEKILLEIESSLSGFIKFFEMDQQIREKVLPLNQKTFENILELKLKRLPATVMILADLAFSEEPINEACLKCLVAMGRVLEIKISLMRDFKRFQTSDYGRVNSFVLYTEICKSNGMTDMKLIEQSYFNLLKDEKIKLQEDFKKISRDYEDFESVLNIIEEDINNHYKVENSKMNSKF